MTTVFKAGAKTEGGWSFLLSKYVSLGSEAQKNKILEALASSEDVRKLYWYEATKWIWSMETKNIRPQSPLGGGIPLFLSLLTGQAWPGQGGEETLGGWGGSPFSSLRSQARPDPGMVVRRPHRQGFISGTRPVPTGHSAMPRRNWRCQESQPCFLLKNLFLPLARCL